MDKEIIKYSYIHGLTIARDVPTVFPSHWHNSAEFSFILKKGCDFVIKDEEYKPEPGDILCTWPRELHEIKSSPEEGYILLQFSSSLIENNTDIATAVRFLNKCHYISAKKEPELAKKISGLVDEFLDIYYNKQYFVETKCKIIIYNILQNQRSDLHYGIAIKIPVPYIIYPRSRTDGLLTIDFFFIKVEMPI